MRQSLYTLECAENLINEYLEKGGTQFVLDEGCLVYGLVVLEAPGYKYAVIKEVYQNPWSSLQSIRFYNELPKKYVEMINKMEMEED